MKKTPKQVLGLVGLGMVAATTVFAAGLPSPEALAAETSSITDTITVRVVGSEPNITITNPKSEGDGNITFVYPNVDVDFDYENIEYIHQILTYTNKDGEQTTFGDEKLPIFFPDYIAGSGRSSLFLNDEGYGYGNYVLNLRGDGLSKSDEDSIMFDYLPLTMFVEEADDGKLIANFDYDPANVCSASINIYNNGKLVTPPSPIAINTLTTKYTLPLTRKDEPAKGTYTFETTAYGCDASEEPLYNPYVSTYDYENIYVPDTGSLLTKLNISKVDYLATGLILFFAFAILGLAFTSKKRSYRVARISGASSKKSPTKATMRRQPKRATATKQAKTRKTTKRRK